MEDNTNITRPHVVMIPFPTQGHVRPIMQLAQCLNQWHGFEVTLFMTSHNYKILGLQNARVIDGMHYVDLQEGFPDEYYNITGIRGLFLALPILEPAIKKFVEKMSLEVSRVTCIISDLNVVEGHNTAISLGLPSIAFSTQSVLTLSAKYYVPLLIEDGLLPLPPPMANTVEVVIGVHTSGQISSPEEETLFAKEVTCVPGMYPMKLKDFHSALLMRDLSDPLFRYLTTKQLESLPGRAWILVNTFHELEASVIEAIEKDIGVNMTSIGPLVITPSNRENTLSADGEESSLSSFWSEETFCMEWLDKQKPVSVIYISFGSLANMPVSTLREFAFGLEESQVPFLLVIRPNLMKHSGADEVQSLPLGFEERTKERSLIVSWAPQCRVLSHPATAGFLSHCGWNSVMESISKGVPMLGYPNFADQPMNSRYVVSVWEIGLEFERRADASVDRNEVAKKVKALVAGEAGVRAAALKWKDTARRAVQWGGSSHNNMVAFVKDMYKRAHAYSSSNKE